MKKIAMAEIAIGINASAKMWVMDDEMAPTIYHARTPGFVISLQTGTAPADRQ
jgi:hypothetical protein